MNTKYSKLMYVFFLNGGMMLHSQVGATHPAVSVPPAATPQIPPATGGSTRSPVVVDSSYLIGPDDQLEITVWKEPNFSGARIVRPDGQISLALVGDIPAAGYTPMNLADKIAALLKQYVQDPRVTVNVQSVNSKRIYMVGQVGHTGPMILTAGMTPLQAISAAGGPSPFANQKKIYILRKSSGKEQKIPFNYKYAVKTGDMQGIVLMPDDTVVIP